MPSLLLDLPTELRHRVYDALEIDDRIRLNAALPREDRITRTMRTDAKRDRTLGVVARFMKRRHVPFRELEGKIRMFVRENGDDPTIARLFPEVGPPDDPAEVRARLAGLAGDQPRSSILAGSSLCCRRSIYRGCVRRRHQGRV